VVVGITGFSEKIGKTIFQWRNELRSTCDINIFVILPLSHNNK